MRLKCVSTTRSIMDAHTDTLLIRGQRISDNPVVGGALSSTTTKKFTKK